MLLRPIYPVYGMVCLTYKSIPILYVNESNVANQTNFQSAGRDGGSRSSPVRCGTSSRGGSRGRDVVEMEYVDAGYDYDNGVDIHVDAGAVQQHFGYGSPGAAGHGVSYS